MAIAGMDSSSDSQRRRLALVGLALAAIIFLGVNVLANAAFTSWQLDLTEDELYSLSPGTSTVLAAIDEPIAVELYFSDGLGQRSPLHANFYNRVRELLERYADLSGGRLQLDIRNPQPFTDVEDRAVASGLQGVPLGDSGDLGYFGLVASNSTDGQEVVPFFNAERERFVEYDLTSLIHRLANPKKKVLAVLSSLPVLGAGRAGRPAPPWLFTEQIGNFFDVRPMTIFDKQVPDDADLLLIIHPKGFDDILKYAIDQFVLGGGKVIVFVDPNAEVQALSGMRLPDAVSDFNRLLEAWGARLVKDKVVGDRDAAQRVNAPGGNRPVVADYVVWLNLMQRHFDQDDVVSGDIRQMIMATAGILEPVPAAGTSFAPLVQTGARAMPIDTVQVIGMRPDPLGLLRAYKDGDKRLALAARLTGPVKSAFPEGPPKAKEAEKKTDAKEEAAKDENEKAAKAAHLAASKGPINVIVVADVDMLYDEFWVNQRDFFGQKVLVPISNNVDFLINALDNLSGSEALVGLRGRGQTSRPFTMVDEIRRDAEARFRSREQTLLKSLQEIQRKLTRLKGGEKAQGEAILPPEAKREIEKFRQEMVVVRRGLRDVQQALRADIESLDSWLKFFNIAAIPLLLGIATVVAAVLRRRRPAPGRTA